MPKPKPSKRSSGGKQQAGGSSQATPSNRRVATRSQAPGGRSQATPSNRRLATQSQAPVTPRSQQLRSGNRRKGTPMSLTNKKRRLQLHAADSSPEGASEDSSAHQIELAGASAAVPDSSGSGAAVAMAEDSDDDEELRAFELRRREINAGKKRKADGAEAEATDAAAECARRAAGLCQAVKYEHSHDDVASSQLGPCCHGSHHAFSDFHQPLHNRSQEAQQSRRDSRQSPQVQQLRQRSSVPSTRRRRSRRHGNQHAVVAGLAPQQDGGRGRGSSSSTRQIRAISPCSHSNRMHCRRRRQMCSQRHRLSQRSGTAGQQSSPTWRTASATQATLPRFTARTSCATNTSRWSSSAQPQAASTLVSHARRIACIPGRCSAAITSTCHMQTQHCLHLGDQWQRQNGRHERDSGMIANRAPLCLCHGNPVMNTRSHYRQHMLPACSGLPWRDCTRDWPCHQCSGIRPHWLSCGCGCRHDLEHRCC